MTTSLAGSSYAETLNGKRVLVTGGTRGMGAAIAELLSAQQARGSSSPSSSRMPPPTSPELSS